MDWDSEHHVSIWRPNNVTFKNVHHLFLFTIESFLFFKCLLQQSLLKTIYRVTNYYSTRQKKKQPYMKIPTQHYTAGRSLQQFFTGNLQRCFHNFFEWRWFYQVWPIGGAHIRRGACLSGDANSRIYGSWGASWGSSISVILIWGFRYIQLKPDTLHLLDAEHILRYTVTLT